MTTFELESALVEFIGSNTDEFRFRSNEETDEMVPPSVWSGFIPRDEVGSVVPGDITTYPAIIVNAQAGTQQIDREVVTINILIGCFDDSLDQQGYRDCCNIVQRLKDRFREIDILGNSGFALSKADFLLSWQMNKKYGSGGGATSNGYPYFFAEMQVNFDLPVMSSQFDLGIWDGDVTPGRYNELPIPTPPPLEHDKSSEPPLIEWGEEHD